ncbi:2-oxo acid dehydrogenase subunit E2, partial [Rhodococcus qingshengii]|uniref:2-oxo acid dehydrogenase subunit E2 n=1 Tax=Rhodococcus qingshengii TaxID=334542 RepID=UPI001BE68AB6
GNGTASPFVLICRATLLMLRRFPPLNSVYDGEAGEIRLLEDINLGIAVDTPGGLLVANVKRAQQLSTLQLAFAIDEVVARCRAGKATPADLTGGTFTVNNFGYFGNDDGNPIINTPEAAILGIGAIRPRPWVVGDQIMARRIARVSLAFDHRVCDGGDAGRAVTYLSELCEDPTSVLLHA